MTDAALSPEEQLKEQLIDDIASFTHDPLGYVHYAFPWGKRELNLSTRQVRVSGKRERS